MRKRNDPDEEPHMTQTMSDLDMVRACAEALGYVAGEPWENGLGHTGICIHRQGEESAWAGYDPIHDDAQAMALVKRFRLWIGGWLPTGMVTVSDRGERMSTAADLNRAIVQCVARMHKETK